MLFFLIFLFVHVFSETRLNDFIQHYEPLDYSSLTLHQSHTRHKRSPDKPITLSFNTSNRVFTLKLVRDDSIFGAGAQSMNPDGTLQHFQPTHIYKGVVLGNKGSYVHGSIIQGIFSGRIDLDNHGDTYYIEKSELFFKNKQPFHSIMYHDKHSVMPTRRFKRSSTENFQKGEMDGMDGCGYSDSKVREWMQQVQNSAVDQSQDEKAKLGEKFSNYYDDERSFANRYKRQTNEKKEKPKKMCSLFLRSDPMLWEYMTREASGKSGGLGYSSERAREEITSLFASHVDGIKKIFSNTQFRYNDIGPYTGFTFAVHRVQINTTSDCLFSHQGQNHYAQETGFCKKNMDVSNFLNLNSISNHDLYCLAYVFTYRDFSQGTLGLAWVGSNLRSSGGLCERWKQYNENNRMVYKSLNTGIVTLVNYGSRVPTKVSTLTFAHEVGHNFGSPHDTGENCVPSLNNPNNVHGNYIMFASATSGEKPNNHEFSYCSIANITLVLEAVLNRQNGKDNCFMETEEAFCGNRIVEADEQCDCGFSADCSTSDHCCHPRESSQMCTRKSQAACSPSEGPCCNGSSCHFVSSEPQVMCMAEKECSKVSYCSVSKDIDARQLSVKDMNQGVQTGTDAKCPSPEPKEELTLCNSKTQVCKNGDCVGSVCEKVNWTMCSMEAPKEDRSFDRGQLCFVACLNRRTGECVSTGNKEQMSQERNNDLLKLLRSLDLEPTGIQLPAGAPCDNFNGYCDVFQKCRPVNEDGPLARLKNLLFNKKTINDIKAWVTEKWWAVLLISVGIIVMMCLFIKCGAVHTPSSNPNQPPARKLTLPRRHHQRAQPITFQTPIGPPPPYSATPPSTHQLIVQPHLHPQPGKRRPQQGMKRRSGHMYEMELKPRR